MGIAKKLFLAIFLGLFVFLSLMVPSTATAADANQEIGLLLSLWSVLPFVGMLLSIALCPILTPHFWHLHYGKVTAFWALSFALPFFNYFPELALREISYICLVDYVPFLILLWGLFTIAGGIVITGSFSGTPRVNTLLLLIGTLLASWVGTTGASMIMIRPLLRANKSRQHKAHVVCFFIFLVANIGGCLTPLGDPPLFLGFLHRVPFFWVTQALLPHLLLTVGILLTFFFALDSYFFLRENQPEIIHELEDEKKVAFRLDGGYNLLLLAGVVGMVIISGCWNGGECALRGMCFKWQNLARDGMILILGAISLLITPERFRKANDFSWSPMIEVAKLFAGIFITIIPVLAILKTGLNGPLAGFVALIKEPLHYYWASGILSSFLDNAPTYLTFFQMALGRLGLSEAMVPSALAAGTAAANPAFIGFLKAISIGAVFMGANTYIGNAPNFMVYSIAKEFGVKMPSFFGYIFRYSLPILIPVFIVVGLVFF